MTWNRDWESAGQNIFEALKITAGDRLAILYNPLPKGKEALAKALEKLAYSKGIETKNISLTLDEDFKIDGLEIDLYKFFEGTKNNQRKFFFTASNVHYGPARRAVHKLISVDPSKLYGYTISLATDEAAIVSDLAATSPKRLWERGIELRKILSQAAHIKITSKKGTVLDFDWDNSKRKYLISAGYAHTHEDHWDNLGGEVYTAPLHKTVNGRLVIDGAIAGIGLVDGTILVDVKNGRGAIQRKGSTASKKTIDDFEAEINIFPNASIVGEFGIGTTPGLKLRGELLNDEKVEGTIHIAFGDSYASDGSGGENNCDAHTDCMILEPTVEMTIDDKIVKLMVDGKFTGRIHLSNARPSQFLYGNARG